MSGGKGAGKCSALATHLGSTRKKESKTVPTHGRLRLFRLVIEIIIFRLVPVFAVNNDLELLVPEEVAFNNAPVEQNLSSVENSLDVSLEDSSTTSESTFLPSSPIASSSLRLPSGTESTLPSSPFPSSSSSSLLVLRIESSPSPSSPSPLDWCPLFEVPEDGSFTFRKNARKCGPDLFGQKEKGHPHPGVECQDHEECDYNMGICLKTCDGHNENCNDRLFGDGESGICEKKRKVFKKSGSRSFLSVLSRFYGSTKKTSLCVPKQWSRTSEFQAIYGVTGGGEEGGEDSSAAIANTLHGIKHDLDSGKWSDLVKRAVLQAIEESDAIRIRAATEKWKQSNLKGSESEYSHSSRLRGTSWELFPQGLIKNVNDIEDKHGRYLMRKIVDGMPKCYI